MTRSASRRDARRPGRRPAHSSGRPVASQARYGRPERSAGYPCDAAVETTHSDRASPSARARRAAASWLPASKWRNRAGRPGTSSGEVERGAAQGRMLRVEERRLVPERGRAVPERLHQRERAAAEARVLAEDGEVRAMPCGGYDLSSLRHMPTRPRLLVLNQYYWPGVEATAHLLTELCEALAETHDVTVLTGAVRGKPSARCGTESRSSESARRRTTGPHLIRRASTTSPTSFGSSGAAMFSRRPDLVICMTDPPFVASIARLVARAVPRPLLIVMQDVFPEIAVVIIIIIDRASISSSS